jgi:hypothetical protein
VIDGTRGCLSPVGHRARWIAWGISLQVVGVGIPVVVVLGRASKEGVAGQISRYTVRLAWHEVLQSGPDLALIALAVAVFAGGSVLLARPFVRRRSTLLVAVPLAATAGVLVLGVAVLACVALIALAHVAGDGDLEWLNGSSWSGDWPGRRRRDDRDDD